MSVAHVICCNDSVEAVVLDDEDKANVEKERLAKEHYDSGGRWHGGHERTYEDYRKIFYWHLHSVAVV